MSVTIPVFHHREFADPTNPVLEDALDPSGIGSNPVLEPFVDTTSKAIRR